MKKNKMMRVASALLVAVLLTTCAISGTFAKYVTEATGTDSARVAKWGVQITANGTTFAKEYATDNAAVVGTIAKSVVSSETDKNVLAPGTSGTMVAMTIAGTPEVAVSVKYEATVAFGDNWKDSTDAYYCPIEIKVGADTLKGSDYTSATEFADAVEAKIAAYSENYAAGTDLSAAATVETPSVSWSWPFTTGSDEKDTYLGNQAATGNAATVSIEIKTTVEQID